MGQNGALSQPIIPKFQKYFELLMTYEYIKSNMAHSISITILWQFHLPFECDAFGLDSNYVRAYVLAHKYWDNINISIVKSTLAAAQNLEALEPKTVNVCN